MESEIVLLDGGMGQELLRRGASGDGTMWSGWALVEDLDAVAAVHRDFVAAGADVLTTNSYVLTRPRLEGYGMADRFVELNELAGGVCRQVADEADRSVRVAGSLPPQFASYQVELPVDENQLSEMYVEQAGVLAPYCHLMLAETLSSVAECRAAVSGARSTGLPVWLGCTLADHGADTLRSGESLEDLLDGLSDQMPDALLFNCTSPESITTVMSRAESMFSVPVGGYGNGFTHIPDQWRIVDDASLPDARVDLDPAAYSEHVSRWLEDGASIVGGCCEIGPDHIAALRSLIDS